MHIREFDVHKDLNRLRECVIELQDFERRLDLRRPAGADIVDAYIPQMRERCEKCHGRILVAEADGEIAGYVMILTKVRSEDLEDGDVEYGLVADLVILEKFRKMGFGKKLLEAAEAHAMSNGVRWLRVGVLAGNSAAMNLYSAMGFSDSYIELEKSLSVGRHEEADGIT